MGIIGAILGFITIVAGVSLVRSNTGRGVLLSEPHDQPPAPSQNNPQSWPDYLNRAQVFNLAKSTVNTFGFKASPVMLTSIADIESDFHRFAYRYESHIDDASYGIMQTLWETAKWLNREKGYNAQPLNNPQDLYDPAISMYYGAAYIDWLTRAYGGSESQIIRRYNGGPRGDERAATLPYLGKYQIAKALTEGESYA